MRFRLTHGDKNNERRLNTFLQLMYSILLLLDNETKITFREKRMKTLFVVYAKIENIEKIIS